MNCSNYINRFLKSRGWDVASDKPDAAPTTVTNSREWDKWMKAHKESSNTEHAPTASITTTGLSYVYVNSPTPDLSDDKLVTLQLKNKNINNDFALMLTLPKDKVNKKFPLDPAD